MKDAAFYVCAVVLLIFFYGEPDLHDKILQRLDNGCSQMEAK